MTTRKTQNQNRFRRSLHGVVVWLLRITGDDQLLQQAADTDIPPLDADPRALQDSCYQIRGQLREWLNRDDQ